MSKQSHTTTNTDHEEWATVMLYYVDATGIGNSAQLEVEIDGDWYPAAATVTNGASATLGKFDIGESRKFRWNVTRALGTITTLLEPAG